jgi:predicted metal-binding membrane protein
LNLLSRQPVVTVAALGAIVALSWGYLFLAAADMRLSMAGMDRSMIMPPKGVVDLLLLLAMWWVMMMGMMLPSAAPMILTFANVNRNRRARGQPYVPTALFTAGYLLVWGGFSVAATLAQWALESATLLSAMDMTVDSRLLGGFLFLAAGLYQFTPIKQACLRFCWSPLGLVLNHWRDGRRRRTAYGYNARPVLPRLLLGFDVVAVRRRRDEPSLDRWSRRDRPDRKAHAAGTLD